MPDLRHWLLTLAQDTMQQEGSNDAAHDFDHLLRVMRLAETLQKSEGGDLPTIQAGVAFHDIGQERERRSGGDHALIGAEMAADLLTNTIFPQHAIPHIRQIIREHRMTGKQTPQSIEGRILYDADKLDCLGAIGIGRLFMITGHYQQKVYSTLPPEVQEPVDPLTVRQLRRRPDYSPAIEFQLLFKDLPSHMHTSTGQALAQERFDYMKGFFARLHKEVTGEL